MQSNNEEDFDLEEEIFSEVLHPLDEIEEFEDMFSPPLDNPQEEVSSIYESRNSTQQLAIPEINLGNSNRRYRMIRKLTKGGKLS